MSGLLERIDALVFGCRVCVGTGRWEQGACPMCTLAREVRAVVYAGLHRECLDRWTVGPITVLGDRSVLPTACADCLTPVERGALVGLVRRAPRCTPVVEIVPHLARADGDPRLLLHDARVVIGRLRPKVRPFDVRIVTESGYGYRIEPVPASVEVGVR